MVMQILDAAYRPSNTMLRIWGALALVAVTAIAAMASQGPTFIEIERVAVEAARARGLLVDDLLAHSDASAVFDKLAAVGWKVDQRDELARKTLPDSDYLVKELRTSDGKKFMRAVAKMPGAFDRLDRMSRLNTGKPVIKQLVAAKDGAKMLEYMTSPTANPRLNNMLSGAPSDAQLGRPTGRIYTLNQLLIELKKLHDRSAPAK